jgi:hypothetical protein
MAALFRGAAAQKAAVEAADDQKCQSYGAKPGTDAYVACRMNIENHERRSRQRGP